MSAQSIEYFRDVDAGVRSHLKQQWQEEIRNAEATRLEDRSVMDVMRVRDIPKAQILPATSLQAPEMPVQHWIQFAIDLEEKQYVCFFSHPFTNVHLL